MGGLAARTIFDDLFEQNHVQMEAAVRCLIFLHFSGVRISMHFLEAKRSVISKALCAHRDDIQFTSTEAFDRTMV